MLPNGLLAWRKSKGLSQKQLANRLNVTRRTIIRWEQGDTPVPDDMELQLQNITGAVDTAIQRVTSHITPASHPHLFVFNRNISRHMPTKWHPNSLARRGLFGWPGCIWMDANWHRCIPAHPDMLDTDEYDAACADLAAGRLHPGVMAVASWFETRTVPEGVVIAWEEPKDAWPWLVLNEAVEPLEGFNALPDILPRPLSVDCRYQVQKLAPWGYYWSPRGIVMLDDPL